MNRFLAALSVLLFSTLSVILFGTLSVNAQATTSDFNLTDKVIFQPRKGQEQDHTKDFYSWLRDQVPENGNGYSYTKQQFINSFDIAMASGTWGVVQTETKSAQYGDYKNFILFWTHKKHDDCSFEIYKTAQYNYSIRSTTNVTDSGCRFYSASYSIDGNFASYHKSQALNFQLSFQNEFNRGSLVFFTGDYTVHSSADGSVPIIPKHILNKTEVKFPLRIFSVANKHQGSAEVNAFLDTELFDKFNPGVPYPSMYSVQLFNSKKEELPGIPTLDGTSVNKWPNVPYGEYRVLFVGYYTGDNFDRYVGKPSVVDIRVTEDGFHYLYDPNKDKFCFFKNGISSADTTLTTVDPNTGSWLSPGSAPTRCIDQDPWDKDLHSEISAGYNLEEIPPCNTLDLACHISRAISTITGWISQFFMWLFVPNSDFVSNNFKSFLNNLQNSLGFLWTPVSVIQAVYTGIIDNKISGDTCALPQMTLFGATSTIHLCAWRYQFPQLWQHMQLAIQGGLAVSFVWVLYRLLMKFFSIHIEDHDDDDDGITIETHADVSRYNSKYVNRQRGGMPK